MRKMYKVVGSFLLALLTVGDMFGQVTMPSTFSWSPAGPVLSAGRSRNLLIDRNNNNHLYVGSTSSGVFESNDGGANWHPLNDQGTIRNISYLAQAANGDLFASTGEGFLRLTARQKAAPGTGVYKVSGTTFTQIVDSSVVGSVITRIACHPSISGRMAVAGNKGLFITEDGTTFVKASGAIAPTATALTVHYDNSGNIYATATSVNTGGGVKVYKSAGGSASGFVEITPTSAMLPNSNYGRIELAIANSNNSTIYASIARPTSPNINNSSASMFAFFVSKDGGSTWTLILEASPQLDPLSNGGTINSGDYAHAVTVNPANEDQVFVAGYRFYIWTKTPNAAEGIGTWVRHGNELAFGSPIYLRHNIHDIKVINSGSAIGKVFFVTDAGVYRNVDLQSAINNNFPATFQPFFKGLGTAQYNSISIQRFPKTANQSGTLQPYSGYLAGTAGNGINYFSGNYPAVSLEINDLSGDMANVEFSNISPNTAYMANTTGNMFLVSDIANNSPGTMLASHLGSKCSQEPAITQIDFRGISNGGSTTDGVYTNNSYSVIGTPFKLWENVRKQASNNAPLDSAIFYNDSIRVLIPVTTTTETAYQVNFIKPQKSAILDKVIIRTFTVGVPSAASSTCFVFSSQAYSTAAQQKASMEFNGAPNSLTIPNPTNIILTGLSSPSVNSVNNMSIVASEYKDVVRFQLPTNPISGSAITNTTNYQYVRVGVTAFYRYNSGTKIFVENSNISSSIFKDSLVLSSAINWNFNDVGTSSITATGTNPPIKFKMRNCSRLAILNDKGVLISKRPLNTNDPQKFQMVSCTGALTTNSSTYTAGQMTVTGLPYLLEWAPDGKSIYYVTSVTTPTPTFRVYKVNVSASMFDFSIEDYRGAFYTGCVNGVRNSATNFSFTTNFKSPYRTTLIGTFNERITNLAVSDNNKLLLLTTSDISTGGKRVYLSSANIDDANVDNTVITFTDKTGNLPGVRVNCALFVSGTTNNVMLGTDEGVYLTTDINNATPTWAEINNNQLPKVQITDIKQQFMSRWDSYNSGIIYVATNGRGAWINRQLLDNTVIGVDEKEVAARTIGLSLFPNPTNGMANLNFYAASGEDVVIQLIDLNGRLVKSEALDKLMEGYVDYKFNTSELNSGVYIVNVASSLGIKRVTKLVVTK